jgi:hypothetical protein
MVSFSSIPRMAPPPVGSEIAGIEGAASGERGDGAEDVSGTARLPRDNGPDVAQTPEQA